MSFRKITQSEAGSGVFCRQFGVRVFGSSIESIAWKGFLASRSGEVVLWLPRFAKSLLFALAMLLILLDGVEGDWSEFRKVAVLMVAVGGLRMFLFRDGVGWNCNSLCFKYLGWRLGGSSFAKEYWTSRGVPVTRGGRNICTFPCLECDGLTVVLVAP